MYYFSMYIFWILEVIYIFLQLEYFFSRNTHMKKSGPLARKLH